MQVVCSACAKSIDYSGDRPRFCAFCGQTLGVPRTPWMPTQDTTELTAPPDDADATVGLPPEILGEIGREVPETIGGYRLLRRLGGGGMGAVYEAEETASGRRVALKLVLPQYAAVPETLVRFRQEGRLASALAHPRCVFVLAADEEAGRPYIVMELMPGATLDDLVRAKGPLPVEEAIAKILDVIEGLQEAHRLGLVHRDVKPSNCFLDAGGRVKIGDFGLSRSLVDDTKLTRTGAFVGTPLFAAPEQIHKKDPTDAQSDVYAVAATLYFLLTGRAPFQSAGDAMATMARIVTDSAPPMRRFRPRLPRGLDRVVLRGLERDRRRRWRNMREFQRALTPFLPAQPSVGGLGLRFGAHLIDMVLLAFLGFTAGQAFVRQLAPPGIAAGMLFGQISGALLNLGYFGILEGMWGCSPGKWLLRLRVGTLARNQAPGLGRALLRAGSLYLLFQIGPYAGQAAMVRIALLENGRVMTQEQAMAISIVGLLVSGSYVLAIVLTVAPMRARNGYRGLHEFISGTRTYQLRWPRPRPRHVVQSRPFHLDVTQPDGIPSRLGPFHIQGALCWTDAERTLLAEDPQLHRSVWLWLRPASAPALDSARRDISRATRIRWVACGMEGAWQWDAFLAPAGMPLSVLAAGLPRLSWADARPILEDLAEELQASCVDGTLPHPLTVQQVWVQPDGRVQLIGTLPVEATDVVVGDPASRASEAVAGPQRALRFLRAAAVLTLEGTARPLAETGESVHAPLPAHATAVLDRLVGGRPPYATPEELRQDLEMTRDRPAEVSRLRRAGHLAFTTLLLHLPFGGPLVMAVSSYIAIAAAASIPGGRRATNDFYEASALTGMCFVFWVVWAFIFRGGYAYWRGGIVLRRANGHRATRLQCAARALLVWGPVAGLYGLAIAVASYAPDLPWLSLSLWGVATALLPLYVVLALVFPRRLVHDRLVGTYAVPE